MRLAANSQTNKALLLLRQLILEGRIDAAKRLTEACAVEATGVSRTPVRVALQRLAEEGLVQELPNGGYQVQTFSEQHIADTIELRGVIEGLAARLAAERGVAKPALERMRALVCDMDERLHRDGSSEASFNLYADLNAQFHGLLADASASAPVLQEWRRLLSTPFASPSAFIAVEAVLPEARRLLVIANDQHKCVVDALEAREGARAESLMREHARLAMRNLKLATTHGEVLKRLPGGRLIHGEKNMRPPRRKQSATND